MSTAEVFAKSNYVFLWFLGSSVWSFQFWNWQPSIVQIWTIPLCAISIYYLYKFMKINFDFLSCVCPQDLASFDNLTVSEATQARGERGESVWLSLNITALGIVPQVLRHPWILEVIKITSKFLSRTTSNVVRGRDEKTCQVWFGSCLAASLSLANNANAQVARAIGQARGQRMRDWNKTLGLLSCSCWGWQPSDADHDGLGRSVITTMWVKVMLHWRSSNTSLTPRKVLKMQP